MKRPLMIDNWMLQDVAELLHSGLPADQASELLIAENGATHSFRDIPRGFVSIDSLFSLLTSIALYDDLLVDEGFVDTWDETPEVADLIASSVVEPTEFVRKFSGDLKPIRDKIVDELAVTESLQQKVKDIRTRWRKEKPDPHFMALMFGGAGMLTRSHLHEVPYFGHALRRRLISACPSLGLGRRDAWMRTSAVIKTARTQMFRYRSGDAEGTTASFQVPPVAVRIIEEATSLSDLIRTALESRESYSRLREWLAEYQHALDVEDEKNQLKFEQTLRLVADGIESSYRDKADGRTGISVSVGWFQFGYEKAVATYQRARNRFGVRSALMSLALSARGEAAIRKLLEMLGEGSSSAGWDVLQFAKKRYSR